MQRFRDRLQSIEDRMELRHQVAVAAGLLCFVLVVVLALGAAIVGRNEAIRSATEDLQRIAVIFTDRLHRGIANRLALAEHLASLPPLRRVWDGPPRELRRVLAETRDALSDTAWVGFVTPDGVIRAAAGGAFEGQSVAHHAWFQRGLSASTVVDSFTEGARAAAAGAPSFADTVIQRFVEIGVPVRTESGAIVGVIGLYFSRNWVNSLRTATIAGNRSQGIGITLIHAEGAIVLDNANHAMPPLSEESRRAMLTAGNGVADGADELGLLTAWAVSASEVGPASLPTWIAVARQNAAVAYVAADRVVWTVLALGVIVGLAGILGAVMIAGHVSRPFRTLADKAALIGRDTNATLPRIGGSFEATRLSTVLRALILRLSYAEKSTAEAEGRAADAARRLNLDIAKLRNLADADTLTELLNRRAFMEFGKDALEQYRRYRRAFAVLMIDIDNFKRVNDGLGHVAGDAVICSVADAIAHTLRPSDKGARFGGDEFVVLLREITPAEARETAERLRARIATSAVAVNGDDLFVTVSIGVAACEDADRDVQALIERADIALYSAKGGGRNRVVLAPAVAAEDRRTA